MSSRGRASTTVSFRAQPIEPRTGSAELAGFSSSSSSKESLCDRVQRAAGGFECYRDMVDEVGCFLRRSIGVAVRECGDQLSAFLADFLETHIAIGEQL